MTRQGAGATRRTHESEPVPGRTLSTGVEAIPRRVRSSSQNVSKKMPFSTDSSMVVKMRYSEDEMSAMLAESKEARKHLRKMGKIMKTAATHRLKELRHLHVVEKVATWRRTSGFDRIAGGDNQWVHGPSSPTPEQIAASMWSDLNALKDAVSMSVKDESSQRPKSFINEIRQGTASFTDEEFAKLKRFMERRGRDSAHVTVASIDTALPCSPRSRSSEISFDVCVCVEKTNEGRMDPERD